MAGDGDPDAEAKQWWTKSAPVRRSVENDWFQNMIDPLAGEDERRGGDERRVELLAGIELAEPCHGIAAEACATSDVVPATSG